MALNWVQLDSRGSNAKLVPLPDETIVLRTEQVTVKLVIPHTLEGPKRMLTGSGSLWITTQRIVFIDDEAVKEQASEVARSPNEDFVPTETQASHMQTLGVPYAQLMKPTTFNQPIFFGANSISIQFLAIAGGGLPATGRDAHLDLAVEFTEGKVHEIWKTLEQTRQKAEMVKADAAWQKDQLPRYEPRQL